MREIDPFSYCIDHASAIEGFGGEKNAPDPRYCFHTQYEVVRPGKAIYRLRLTRVRASRGVLTIRLHAYKPSGGGDVSLAGGSRLELVTDGLQDMELALPFHALKDVNYALYGFFSESSDIRAEGIKIMLDEPEGAEEVDVEPPRSMLAEEDEVGEIRPANALIHYDIVTLEAPVSQSCTWQQLPDEREDGIDFWREAVCLAALPAYGVDLAGLHGWLVGKVSESMTEYLAGAGFAIELKDGAAPELDSGEFADFILWPRAGSLAGEREGRWSELKSWLDRLKIGGLAAVVIDYAMDQAKGIPRNEIGQWVLRLIGAGYSVAPLAWASAREVAFDEDGRASFCLIVRRQ